MDSKIQSGEVLCGIGCLKNPLFCMELIHSGIFVKLKKKKKKKNNVALMRYIIITTIKLGKYNIFVRIDLKKVNFCQESFFMCFNFLLELFCFFVVFEQEEEEKDEARKSRRR